MARRLRTERCEIVSLAFVGAMMLRRFYRPRGSSVALTPDQISKILEPYNALYSSIETKTDRNSCWRATVDQSSTRIPKTASMP